MFLQALRSAFFRENSCGSTRVHSVRARSARRREFFSRNGAGRRLGMEMLEPREVLAAVITATLTDNTAGPVAPGGTIHYTEIISNTAAIGAGNEALNLQIAQALDPNTTLVPGSLNISPLAFDDTFSAVGNTQLFVNAGGTNPGSTPAAAVAGSILANDVEFMNDLGVLDTFTLTTTGTFATTGGGSVTLNADGTFAYTPAISFTGADTFSYTIRDDGIDSIAGNSDDLTGTGLVTINVANKVWYVNNAAAAGGDGRSHSPFDSLADVTGATGPDAAGDIIFVHTGSGNYTGGITLLNNQTLWGQGEALVVGGISLLPAGTDPVITNAAGNGVTLASGNTLKGFTVGDTTGFDIANTATATVGALTVSNVTLNGSGGLFRADSGGTLTVQLDSATTTNVGATGILLTNVDNSTFSVTGATTINDATADGIAVSNSQNSTFTFTGLVTILNDGGANGDGVDLQNNNSADSTFNFNGGVNITVNGAGAFGFRAQSSGTVNIADPGGTTTQITSNNGTALFINPTTLNATLDSVTSGGGTEGISLSGMSGALVIGSVSINGQTGDGIDITNSAGSVTINGGSIGNTNDPAGVGVDISGGAGNVTIAAAVTKTSAGDIVEITGRTGGTVTLSGNLSATGGVANGIDVNGNTGGTINFTGQTQTLTTGANTAVNLAANTGATINFNPAGGGNGLDITTTSGAGFSATGGGTVTVQGSGNSISSGTGTGLNIANTTIGAADVTFQSISVNGAVNGIVLNATGALGGLHVTGDGVNTTLGGNGSGGTIQNTSGAGISLNDTDDVQLNYLNITNSGTDSIRITDINGFTFNRSTISDSAGAAPADKAIDIGDFVTGTPVNGTINFTNSVIGPAAGSTPHDSLAIGISSGTSAWNVTGTTFRNTGNAAINMELRGSSVVTAFLVDGSTFAGGNVAGGTGSPSARGIFANTLDDSVMTLFTIQNNTFTNNNIHIDLNQQNDTDPVGSHTFVVRNNTMTGSRSHAMNIFAAAGSFGGEFTGTINNNAIGNASVDGSGSEIGNGIRVNMNGGTDATILIDDNDIVETPNGRGIEVIGRNGLGTLDITITNNNVDHTNLTYPIGGGAAAFPLGAIFVNAAKGGATGIVGFRVRADVRGNTVPTAGGSLPAASEVTGTYLALVESVGSETGGILELVDSPAGPGGQTPTQQLQSTNTGDAGANAGVSLIAGPIDVPPVVPLLAADGGVEVADWSASDSGDTMPPVITDNSPPATGAAPAQSGTDQPDGGRDVPTHEVIVENGALTQAELGYFVDAAIARWSATGLTAEQVALLERLTFAVANMPGQYLGSFHSGLITLDSDAAGRGWFLDVTPLEDSEFTAGQAGNGTVAAGRLDLLTAVLHEMGHALGIDDTYAIADAGNVMYGFLTLGTRRLPAAGQAAGAIPDGEDAPDYVFSPITIGTLPPQKSVTIVFDATVNSPAAAGVDSVSIQGTVTGTGINVLTNDPDTGAANDPTVTTIDAAPDLRVVSVDDSETTAAPGDTRTYAINYDNIGNQGASGVLLDVTLPAGTTFNAGGSSGTWADQGGGIFRQTIGTLAGGGASGSTTFSYTVNASAPAGVESLVVTATIQDDNANGTDPAGNDSQTDTDTLVASPDLAITKSDSGATLQPGDIVMYVLNESNLGNQDAAGVTLHETVPAGSTFDAGASTVGWTLVTGTGGAGSTYSFTIGALAGGASAAAVNFAVTSDNPFAGTEISNTATIDYALAEDANAANNTATDTTPVISDDLAITKTDGVTSAVPGTSVTYTIVVSSAATSTQTAIGALVNDTFPASLTGVSYTATAAGGATGFTASGSGNIADAVDLPAGSSITYTVTGTIAASATGTLVNTATVTAPAGFVEGNTANNTATDSDTLTPQADLSVSKSDSPDPVIAGTSITYTLDFATGGPSDAQNVSITDAVPAGTTFVSATAPAGWSTMSPAVGGTGNVVFTKSAAVSGEMGTFTIVVNVNASALDGSIITNTATVTSDAADPDSADNTATTTTTVNTLADLSITKTDSPDPVDPGSDITYTITITNAGPSDAQTVSLSDSVPANTTFVSAMQTSGPAFTLTTPPVGGTGSLDATAATLAAGASATFTFVVNVDPATADGTLLSNTATATATTTDPDSANNTDTETTAVQVVNLAVSKTDSPDPVVAGTNLTYTITLTNTGSGTADTVSLSDVIPAGTTFVSATQTSGPAFTLTTPPVGGTGTFSATAATLSGGATANFTLVVNVDASTPDGSTISNTAAVTTTSADQTAGDNSDTETTDVDAQADLSVTKSDSPESVIAGSNLTYTITVTNSGVSDAQNVSLSDAVPTGTTFVSATQSSGPAFTLTSPPAGGTGTFTATAATLAAGATATFSLVVNVSANVTAGATITNTATATSDTDDPDPANNSATATTTLAINVVNGKLQIEGSSEDDIVTITGIPPGVAGSGMYLVTIQQGSGPVHTQTVSGVTGDISVNLHGGNDQLTMNNAYVNGSIIIDMESGNDTVTLGDVDVVSTRVDLDVDLGTENDVLNGRRIFIGGNQMIVGGDGDDDLIFDGLASPFTLGTSAAGNANWSTGNGDDTVHVIYAFIVGAFAIDLGMGTDSLDIFGSSAVGNVSFFGGTGIDSLKVDTNFFDAGLFLDGGADNDTVFLANGLGIEIGTINTGAGADTVTVVNETQGRLNIDTGSGNDTVDVRASALDRLFASLGEDDDELVLFGNLLQIEADLDGGPGGADRLRDLGNDVRGAMRTRNFELFG
jgi:uncharacterized repeat protein (TIGR01451 family)